MPRTQTTQAETLAALTEMIGGDTRSTVERMADVFVTNHQEGRITTETDLGREGFTADEIKDEGQNAAVIARARLRKLESRDVHAAPVKTAAQVEGEMVDVIASLMPPTTLVIAELQARGVPKNLIDLLYPKARARAALGFAQGGMTAGQVQ